MERSVFEKKHSKQWLQECHSRVTKTQKERRCQALLLAVKLFHPPGKPVGVTVFVARLLALLHRVLHVRKRDVERLDGEQDFVEREAQ